MANPRRGSSDRERDRDRERDNYLLSLLKAKALWALLQVKQLLRKPQAFPLLLFIFLLLAWLCLRLEHSRSNPKTPTTHSIFAKPYHSDDDALANLARFGPHSSSSSPIVKDQRGWLLNPVSLALHSALQGGAVSCESVHVGEIRPGGLRGNHRHHFCNETFVIWGATTLFRLENSGIVDKGYAQVVIGADEVAVAVSPKGTAHALINVDPVRTTFFLGCQDSLTNYTGASTDYSVWKDI